jgi:hypothetical protein
VRSSWIVCFSRFLTAFVILSIFAIGSKGDLLDSIKRGINEAEAVYKRTKCINRLIDCEFVFLLSWDTKSLKFWFEFAGTRADTTAISDNKTTQLFDFLCEITFNEPAIWLTVYLILFLLLILACSVCIR